MNGVVLAEGECNADTLDFGGQAGCAVSDAAQGVLEATFEMLVNGTTWAVKWIGSAWLNFPEPTIGTSGGTPSDNLATLYSLTGFYVLGIAVIGFLLAVMRLMAQPSMQTGASLLRGILAIVAVQSLSIGATVLLLDAGNQFSTWVVEQASGKTFETALADFSGLGGVSSTLLAGATLSQSANIMAVAVLGFIVLLLGAVAQVALMIVRSALLVILLAFLPALAASAFTDSGYKALGKALGWLLALVLYKPVAGVIYAVGILTLKNLPENPTPEDQMMNLLIGVVIVGAAALALPALVKFVAPQAAAGASMAFSGGAIAAGAVGTGAAVVGLGATLASGGAAAPAAAAASTGASGAATGAATSGAGGAASGGAAAGATGAASSGSEAGSASSSASGANPSRGDASAGGSGVTGDGAEGTGSDTPDSAGPSGASGGAGGTPSGGSAPRSGGGGATAPDTNPSAQGTGTSGSTDSSDVPSSASAPTGATGANATDTTPSQAPSAGGRHRRTEDIARTIGQAANKADQGAKDTDFNADGSQS